MVSEGPRTSDPPVVSQETLEGDEIEFWLSVTVGPLPLGPESRLWPLLAVCPGTSHLTSLGLTFL